MRVPIKLSFIFILFGCLNNDKISKPACVNASTVTPSQCDLIANYSFDVSHFTPSLNMSADPTQGMTEYCGNFNHNSSCVELVEYWFGTNEVSLNELSSAYQRSEYRSIFNNEGAPLIGESVSSPEEAFDRAYTQCLERAGGIQ